MTYIKKLRIHFCTHIHKSMIYKTNAGRIHYLCKRLPGEIALPLAQIPRISSRNVTIFSSPSRLLSSILSFILPVFSFPTPYYVPLRSNVYQISILRQKFISSGDCCLLGLLHIVEWYNDILQVFSSKNRDNFHRHGAGIE